MLYWIVSVLGINGKFCTEAREYSHSLEHLDPPYLQFRTNQGMGSTWEVAMCYFSMNNLLIIIDIEWKFSES